MATAKITEFNELGADDRSRVAQVPRVPAVAHQSVSFTTSAQSAAFNADTNFVRVHVDADAYLLFGVNPTAAATSMFVKAGLPYDFAVTAGHKVAAFAA